MDKTTEEGLLNSTSIIYTVDIHGNMSMATCFFLRNYVNNIAYHYLVTNEHVLKNKTKAHLYIDVFHKDTSSISYNKKITLNLGKDILISEEYDIAILNISFLNILNDENSILSYSTIGIGMIPSSFDEFSAMQSILMTGYLNGLYNKDFNCPIARCGITATPINKQYEHKDEFVIDIPSIGGSSGSPIFTEVNNKIYLIGIERGTYTRKIIVDKFKNRLYHKTNYSIEVDTQLGIAIRSDRISKMLLSTT